MSARSTADIARHVICTTTKVRHASTTTALARPKPGKKVKLVHGQQIFVYSHFQTNQVVYSLTKSLNNNDALRQLPFNGKKTVPRALRKDLWSPMATITFPPNTSALGLSVYQKLREYRRLHELCWDPEEVGFETQKGKDGEMKRVALSKRQRGRKLCDQKANSVADMAAVLARIGDEALMAEIALGPKIKDRLKGWWIRELRLRRRAEEKSEKASARGEVVETTEKAQAEEGVEKPPVIVEIKWRDMLDAEYAETWSENVVHDWLGMKRLNSNGLDPWNTRKRETMGRVEEEIVADTETNGEKKVVV